MYIVSVGEIVYWLYLTEQHVPQLSLDYGTGNSLDIVNGCHGYWTIVAFAGMSQVSPIDKVEGKKLDGVCVFMQAHFHWNLIQPFFSENIEISQI